MKYEREEKFLMTLSQNKPLGTIGKFFYRTIETKIRFLEVFEKYGIATPDGVRLDELPITLADYLEGLNAERKNTD